MEKAIDYKFNVNNNLSCECFACLIPEDPTLRKGQTVGIKLDGKTLKRTRIHDLKAVEIDELTDYDTLTSVCLTADQFRASFRNKNRNLESPRFSLLLLRTVR